jgi:purine-binding chemotaxis protein CheW
MNGVAVGLIVDTVVEVLSIPEQDIVPPPQINSSFHQRYIKAIGKVGNDVRLLLDCGKLLNDDEVHSLEKVC